MRIFVDGVERARLNPVEQSSISFSADEDAELIEIKTTDGGGELLLATHLLTRNAAASITLEGGQELSLSITQSDDADFLITFGYRETNPLRAARLWWQRRRVRRDARISGRHVLVFASLVIICLASYLAYLRLRSRPTTGGSARVSVNANVPGETAGPTVVQQPTQTPQPAKRDKSLVAKVRPSPSVSAPVENADEDDATRSGNAVPNLKLGEVKKIYVEVRGDGLRSNLIESLRSSGLVTVVTNADDADAALKIVVSKTNMSATLVNARGTVLWRGTKINDLLAEIRRARG